MPMFIRCTHCKMLPFWLGKPLPFMYAPKTGDPEQDRMENRRKFTLCPNCERVWSDRIKRERAESRKARKKAERAEKRALQRSGID